MKRFVDLNIEKARLRLADDSASFFSENNVFLGQKIEIEATIETLITSYLNGGKLLVCGNGGSAADSDHIVGELMKGFELKRPLTEKLQTSLKKNHGENGEKLASKLQRALPAISLTNHTSLNTAFANDVDPLLIFAQQVLGYGEKGDVLLGISTSGNSETVNYAMCIAREIGLTVVGLTGADGGLFNQNTDYCIKVPEKKTYKIQEGHIKIYHFICLCLEKFFFI